MAVLLFFAYSRFGDIFQSIREDEEAAESIGINVAKYKILAFVISAYFAGLAGNLFAQYSQAIYPSMVSTDNSFSVIIMTVIGGIGTVYGGAFGAILITLLINLFVSNVFKIQGSSYLIYGLFLLIVILYLPRGITKARREQKRAFVLGILFAISWMLLSHIDFVTNFTSMDFSILFSNPIQFLFQTNFFDNLFLLILFIVTLPLIPFFIISEQIGLYIFNNILYLGLANEPTRTVRAMFLIDLSVSIPLAYYFPRIFKKLRLKIFGIWPSIGLYEPE